MLYIVYILPQSIDYSQTTFI